MLKRDVYDEEHNLFRDSIRCFFAEHAVPHHEQWEEGGKTPREFWLKAGEQGMLCPHVPEEYGGVGGDYRFNAVVLEEAYLQGVTGPNFAVHSDIVSSYIINLGTEEQKQQWLPKMVSGEVIGGIAMTEPNTGSDLQNIKTTAIRDGDEYVINGSKTFITNGQNGDLFIVVAKTDPSLGAKGISLILVESDRPGFHRGRNLKKMGLKAQDTSELSFDDVRVPVSNLLGQEGKGFAHLMNELPRERLSIVIQSVAGVQYVYDLAVNYVKERKAFGKPVFDFQNTRFTLAEIYSDLCIGWSYVDSCLKAHLKEELTSVDAAAAKLWSTDMQGRNVDKCLQLFGGYGYMSEYPISRAFTDARVQRIYGGTTEIMKEIIGRSI